MKFAGGLAVLIVSCFPLAIACGSAESPNFFSEHAGTRDPGAAGTQNAHAGSGEGGTTSEEGGSAGMTGSVAGRLGTGSGGKSSTAGRGGMSSEGGAASGGTTSAAAGAAGASAGSGGKSNTSAGSGGTSAGASGTAGASAAGSGGNAGAVAGSGGSGGISGASGSSGSGGSSGWSGWGGWNGWGGSGSGGAAGAPTCPVSPPVKGAVCDVTTPDSCFYAGQACSCLSATSGPGPGPINPSKKWACYGDGALCPDTKPVAGASCKGSVDVECPYPGNDYCVCAGTSNDAHWVCQATPPTCAASKPLAESCSTVRTCSWGTNKEQACFCNGSRWGCEGGF